MMVRTGLGYDVHRLVEDRDLILCGVKIPYEKGLLGHSDADVALHALSDALLGAAAMRDIGYHFPDTAAEYKGADSRVLLRRVVELIGGKSYSINNVDVTIIAQRPKLLTFIPQMIENIASDLQIPVDCVSVKATTTEKLGFEGRGEGISAMAVATLTDPSR
ncbi:2-C-methyl-D-erythritol 2,4-cyclodiphosphate synthase [uncultured Duncaniella sp.]|uniref:2-C-methyl-D-erythritol 2,4-cyclodiphosphate synthase n=1 Tax=uncultured Duncaniella sp. TaxID=2768039 RepID=UPI0025D4731D|nr:2-C-methyl-D-erythritol 2,4-cyclodiphosphate synthase [uncultured Duncaniella sp.]